MAKFFTPNITRRGRLFRGACGLAMIVAGLIAFRSVRWLGVVLILAAGFTLFEAVRGWCVMRACGIKTKV